MLNGGGVFLKQEIMKVIKQKKLAPLIFELELQGNLVKEMKTPGQFLHIKVPREDLILRRPISLAKINPERKSCTLIYRVTGQGTSSMAALNSGDFLDVLGPLGNGFTIDFVNKEDPVLIIGGGIGIPPLYELAKQLNKKGAKIVHLLGFQRKEVLFYEAEFRRLGEVRISTDDGSFGVKGHVGDLLEQLTDDFQPAAIYACGANGLLKAVNQRFHDHPNAYLSLEERMACGVGACYACVCPLQNKGNEAKIKMKKVCDEGPVFSTGEVVL